MLINLSALTIEKARQLGTKRKTREKIICTILDLSKVIVVMNAGMLNFAKCVYIKKQTANDYKEFFHIFQFLSSIFAADCGINKSI